MFTSAIRGKATSIHAITMLAAGLALASPSLAGDPFLQAATYTGADMTGGGTDLAPDGSIYVVGMTDDPGLPLALNSKSGFSDMFVMKFSGDLSTLYWSRYMGGTGAIFNVEFATDCAATLDGGVVVTGRSETPDFPLVDAIDDSFGGAAEAVLFKLDADGNIVFSTYIGGSGDENPMSSIGNFSTYVGEVELAPDGAIFLSGSTRSDDFPLVDPIDGTFGGFQADVFFMKLTADGQTILASTYLGDGFTDEVWGMDVDPEGRPVIVGEAGPDWPKTPGAFSYGDLTSSGLIYATKIAADGRSLEWTAWIERTTDSGGHLAFHGVAVAPDGVVTAVGQATGSFPLVPSDAYQPELMGGSPTRDILTLSFSPDGTQLTAGTYLGAPERGEFSVAVGVDSFGQVLVTRNREEAITTRLYKFDPQMTTLLESPITITAPGTTLDIEVDEMNNVLALAAGIGDTTPGAFSGDPQGVYLARHDLQDPPAEGPTADLDGDGVVGFNDLLILLAAWGPCDPPPADCAADIDEDGAVGFGDLLILLAAWSA